MEKLLLLQMTRLLQLPSTYNLMTRQTM